MFSGKFPHLLVSSSKKVSGDKGSSLEAVIDFGKVAVGQAMEKWIELNNLSPVSILVHSPSHPG